MRGKEVQKLNSSNTNFNNTDLKGLVPRRNVFIHSDSFSDIYEIIGENVTRRINLMAGKILKLKMCLNKL